jgi:type IV pilus assembly protein PilM
VPKTLARFITLPPADKRKLADLIKFEAKQQIPFPLEAVTWDHHPTDASAQNESLVEQELGIFAIKSDEALQYLFPLEELKIKVDLLQAEHVALHNYLAFDRHAAFHRQFASDEELPRDQVLAVLDLGANTSNLVIGNRHSMWVRNLPIGSQHLNRGLVSEFRLTQDQAEQLKRNPLLGAFASKAYQAMTPTLRDILGEFERSLGYFEHTYRRRRIKQLLLIGGGFRQHALARLLRDGLKEHACAGNRCLGAR